MLQFGDSVPMDFVKAAEYFQRAAELGDAEAQRYLAYLYETQKIPAEYKSLVNFKKSQK
jgi:TPR repeat protein